LPGAAASLHGALMGRIDPCVRQLKKLARRFRGLRLDPDFQIFDDDTDPRTYAESRGRFVMLLMTNKPQAEIEALYRRARQAEHYMGMAQRREPTLEGGIDARAKAAENRSRPRTRSNNS
jgi:hypothetical protein